MVGIGKCVLRIDTAKAEKGEGFSTETPRQCSVDRLFDGIQLVGKHDGEVTDISFCQWTITRLVSASTDGTVGASLFVHHLLINVMIFFLMVAEISYWSSLVMVNS